MDENQVLNFFGKINPRLSNSQRNRATCIFLTLFDKFFNIGPEDCVEGIEDFDTIYGDWWVVRGVNCGQEGWPGSYDW